MTSAAPRCGVTECRHYNDPQQIGYATSRNGVHWTRIFQEPLLPNGKPGQWNSSASGHPGIFVDDDRQTSLFDQGNHVRGRTWFLSWVKLGGQDGRPFILPGTEPDSPRAPHR